MSIKEILDDFYSNYDEDGRLLSRYGQVEFRTTMRYIEKYLRKGMRVLEVGAGTGRYSHAIAQMGYQVDAVELTEHNIGIFKQNTQPGERVSIAQGDATHLDGIEDETYDITLLLGPMYHLFDDDSRMAALTEATRVTKRGGVVFAAYVGCDACVMQFVFGRNMINTERYKSLVDRETFTCADDPEEVFSLMRKENIDALMAKLREKYSVERLHYVGTDMFAHYMRDTLAGMDDETFSTYMDYHFVICERGDMVGVSNHFLDVFVRR